MPDGLAGTFVPSAFPKRVNKTVVQTELAMFLKKDRVETQGASPFSARAQPDEPRPPAI